MTTAEKPNTNKVSETQHQEIPADRADLQV